MSTVGLAPWHDLKRRTIRAPVNPMDKATIISIYPRKIDEVKHTIQPGRFIIEPGSYDKPSVLVVGPSSWWRDIDDEQPLLEIPVSSIQVADSIVKDYNQSLLECNANDVTPGIFYLAGEKKTDDIKKDYKPLLDKANANQRRWYQALVNMANTLWARSSGNPLSISEDMKLAAQELGQTFDWLKNFQMTSMVKCVACGNLNNESIIVCPNCRVILRRDEFTKLGLSFAQ